MAPCPRALPVRRPRRGQNRSGSGAALTGSVRRWRSPSCSDQWRTNGSLPMVQHRSMMIEGYSLLDAAQIDRLSRLETQAARPMIPKTHPEIHTSGTDAILRSRRTGLTSCSTASRKCSSRPRSRSSRRVSTAVVIYIPYRAKGLESVRAIPPIPAQKVFTNQMDLDLLEAACSRAMSRLSLIVVGADTTLLPVRPHVEA